MLLIINDEQQKMQKLQCVDTSPWYSTKLSIDIFLTNTPANWEPLPAKENRSLLKENRSVQSQLEFAKNANYWDDLKFWKELQILQRTQSIKGMRSIARKCKLLQVNKGMKNIWEFRILLNYLEYTEVLQESWVFIANLRIPSRLHCQSWSHPMHESPSWLFPLLTSGSPNPVCRPVLLQNLQWCLVPSSLIRSSCIPLGWLAAWVNPYTHGVVVRPLLRQCLWGLSLTFVLVLVFNL